MISLVYISAAITEFDADDLQELLNRARQNNSRIGVTGLLLYVGGNILQILEGEEAIVQSLYNQISRDPRHRRLMKLFEGPINERQFGRWSMALANPALLGPQGDVEGLSVIRAGLAGSNSVRLEESVRILLKTFADTMR